MTETTMHRVNKIMTNTYQDSRKDGSKYSVTKIRYYNEAGDIIHTTVVFGKPDLEITKRGN